VNVNSCSECAFGDLDPVYGGLDFSKSSDPDYKCDSVDKSGNCYSSRRERRRTDNSSQERMCCIKENSYLIHSFLDQEQSTNNLEDRIWNFCKINRYCPQVNFKLGEDSGDDTTYFPWGLKEEKDNSIRLFAERLFEECTRRLNTGIGYKEIPGLQHLNQKDIDYISKGVKRHKLLVMLKNNLIRADDVGKAALKLLNFLLEDKFPKDYVEKDLDYIQYIVPGIKTWKNFITLLNEKTENENRDLDKKKSVKKDSQPKSEKNGDLEKKERAQKKESKGEL